MLVEIGQLHIGDEIVLPGDLCGTVTDFVTVPNSPRAEVHTTMGTLWAANLGETVIRTRKGVR
jgi:hypothetical protein